jgi:APA family basic amino acid/polyamine antiporter
MFISTRMARVECRPERPPRRQERHVANSTASKLPYPAAWLRRKSVRALRRTHAAQQREEGGLKRVLGFWSLVAIGVGCTIGAGIFVLPGVIAATKAGPGILLSFVLAAVACAIAALCYAELAVIIPASGSAYSYTYATLGELAGWLIGWNLLLEYGLANSAVAAGWGGYLSQLLHSVGIELPPRLMYATGQTVPGTGEMAILNLPAVIAIAMPTVLMLLGIRESARFNNGMVMAKILVLLMFVAFCAHTVNLDNLQPFLPFGWQGVVSGAGVLFFLFVGFDAVSTVAEECVDPQRDLPRAILFGLTLIALLYVSVTFVLLGNVPLPELAHISEPLAEGLERGGHPLAAWILSAVAVIGILSIILVGAIGQTRILFVMSRDGLMPSFMGKVHSRTGTPAASTVVLGVVTAIMAGTVPLDALADLVSIGTLAAFSAVSLAVVALRAQEPALERKFRAPGSPWLPIIGIAINIWLMSALSQAVWIRFAVWIVVGLAIYFAWGQRSAGMVFDATIEAEPPEPPPLTR